MATDWPTSSRPISLASVQPNSMSFCSLERRHAARQYAFFHEQLRAKIQGRGKHDPVTLELGDHARAGSCRRDYRPDYGGTTIWIMRRSGQSWSILQGVYITFLVTLPAMTTRLTPSAAKRTDHLPELGHADRLERSHRAPQLSEASYRIPTQATCRPCRRAASAKRIGNRPLPASRPIGSVGPARADERGLLRNAQSTRLLADPEFRSSTRVRSRESGRSSWPMTHRPLGIDGLDVAARRSDAVAPDCALRRPSGR